MKAMEMPIRQLSYYCNNTKCGDCEIKEYIGIFGKTVFLTREETEAKLKGGANE